MLVKGKTRPEISDNQMSMMSIECSGSDWDETFKLLESW